MKLLLAHSLTKRTIEGEFAIRASREDLLSLAKQITTKLESDDTSFDVWVTIQAKGPKSLAGQTKGWND